jgi:C4-dicarboxylate-specific signal transduction histidine kinase
VFGTLLRYFLPIVAVATACAATYVLDLAAPASPNLFLFFVAIVAVGWYLGAGPGWLSVVVSVVAVDFLFLPPIHVLDFSVKDIPWFVAFVLSAAATNALSLKRRRTEEMLIQARGELEQRVRERTLDLQQTNEKLIAETVERARAEAVLRETRDELVRAARIATVAELTASIAHEINQPLAAVVANSEAALNWLKRSPPAFSEAKESIAGVVAAGERAAEVINRIRILMTKGAGTWTKVDVNELVDTVLSIILTSLAKRNVALECRLEPGLPLVLGDRVQLQQSC